MDCSRYAHCHVMLSYSVYYVLSASRDSGKTCNDCITKRGSQKGITDMRAPWDIKCQPHPSLPKHSRSALLPANELNK